MMASGKRRLILLAAAGLAVVGVAAAATYLQSGTIGAAGVPATAGTAAAVAAPAVSTEGLSPKALAAKQAADAARAERAAASESAATRRLRGHYDGIQAVAFSPTSGTLLTASHDTTAALWDPATGARLAVLEGHGAGVYSAAFSRDGRLAATGAKDGQVIVWDVTAKPPAVVALLGWHRGTVTNLAFLPDGVLLSAGVDGTLREWDVEEESIRDIQQAQHGTVVAFAVSPDGSRVVTGGSNGHLVCRSLVAGDEMWRVFPPTEPRGMPHLQGADFSPDGTKVYSLGFLGQVHEWDAADGRHRRRIEGPHTPTALATHPDGKHLAIAAQNGFELWDLATMKSVHTFVPCDPAFDLAFDRTGRFLAQAYGGYLSAKDGWRRDPEPQTPVWDMQAK